MKVAVISDIHENFHNLILCLNDLKLKNVECILCLGDLMNAGVAKILAVSGIPCFMIWGNNDGEKVDILKTVYQKGSQLKVSSQCYDFIELGDRKVFMSHYDDLAIPMATSGFYDAVFYGHNHSMKVEKLNNCWVVNPGEICAQKTGIANYAIYDTETNDISIETLEGSISYKTELVSNYLKTHADALDFRSADVFKMKS